VNGAPYYLDQSTASIGEKITCGFAPGPNAVTFVDGNFTGPAEGNYSYQDITLYVTNVSSVRIDALGGAGWGIDGVGVNCDIAHHLGAEPNLAPPLFPATASGAINLPEPCGPITLVDVFGRIAFHLSSTVSRIDVSALSPGPYVALFTRGGRVYGQRILIY
jgi:hypothetical protein